MNGNLTGPVPLLRHHLGGLSVIQGMRKCNIQQEYKLSVAPTNYGSKLESRKGGTRNFIMRPNGS
jgi:hypothetical protein